MPLETIALSRLAIAFLPVVAVIGIMWRWQLQAGKAAYAMLRMLLQLLLIGYVLVAIFQADSGVVVSKDTRYTAALVFSMSRSNGVCPSRAP